MPNPNETAAEMVEFRCPQFQLCRYSNVAAIVYVVQASEIVILDGRQKHLSSSPMRTQNPEQNGRGFSFQKVLIMEVVIIITEAANRYLRAGG